MRRSPTPFTRALALFLCCQPVLWMSHVALAQSVEQQAIQAQQQGDPRFFQGQQGNQQQMQMQQMQQGGAQQGGILQGTGAAPQQGGVFNQFPPANVPGEQEGMRPEKSLQHALGDPAAAGGRAHRSGQVHPRPERRPRAPLLGGRELPGEGDDRPGGEGLRPPGRVPGAPGQDARRGAADAQGLGGPLLPEARLRGHPGRAPHLPRAGGGRRGAPRLLPGQGHRARGHAHHQGRGLRAERLPPPHRGEAARRDACSPPTCCSTPSPAT